MTESNASSIKASPRVEVLVSVMHQNDYKQIEKMGIQSDAIIVNQGSFNEIKEVGHNNHRIRFLSLNERGVGLSRNTALMRANQDICLFADEDETLVEGYEDIILREFDKYRRADMILFNVPSTNPERPTYIIPKNGRVRWYNSLRYGAVKIAVRTNKVKKANVFFSLAFGGGTSFSSGEDSIFISDCLKKGLKIYANNNIIGYVSQGESTWFKGYTTNFFIDKGALFACLNRRWAKLLCIQFAIRRRNLFVANQSLLGAVKLMFEGIKKFDSL